MVLISHYLSEILPHPCFHVFLVSVGWVLSCKLCTVDTEGDVAVSARTEILTVLLREIKFFSNMMLHTLAKSGWHFRWACCLSLMTFQMSMLLQPNTCSKAASSAYIPDVLSSLLPWIFTNSNVKKGSH